MKSEGWFLYSGDRGAALDSVLVRETFELSAPQPHEVLAEPLFGGWEGAMHHALSRSPIDVVQQRGEKRVILGNSGVVRVVECGREVTSVEPGQYAVIFSASQLDPYGYPTKIHGFDAPGSIGCLATKIVISGRNLIALPNARPESLPRWAGFSVRYMAAWSNWQLAYGLYRLMISEAEDPTPNVWGWGGGTTLAELDLARRFGCRTAMISGNDRRLEIIRQRGITPIDRRQFDKLDFEQTSFASDPAYRRQYVRAENAFLKLVETHTEGRKVQIFVDNIGSPVFRATARALSREGIIATTGWKQGMQISYARAVACVNHQQHVNTHFARFEEGPPAVRYAQANDWLPHIEEPIYSFDQIPQLACDFASGRVGMFPVYKVT